LEGKPYKPYDHVVSADDGIRMFQARIKANPKDVLSYTMLATMYIRKAREMSDYASYDRAEVAARRAVELKPDDLPAQGILIQALCAQHKFKEGLTLARKLLREHPEEPHVLALIGDAQLELGNYTEAEKAYRDLKKKDPEALLESRLARLAELKGNTKEALERMHRAAEEEGANVISKEGRAWFPFRLGELYYQAGKLDEAARFYKEALEWHPRYPLALAFLGRVRTAQGKYDEAIQLYGQAVAVNADLTMLAELGDLYARTGKAFLARLNYDKLEKVAQGKPAYNRELALFYANHDRKLPEALELARQDLEVRQDVYAYDTLAWALYKNKRHDEAAHASAEALKLGTRDPLFLFHAGMIQHALGHGDRARAYLEQALAINPHFSLLHEDQARQTIKELGSKGGSATSGGR